MMKKYLTLCLIALAFVFGTQSNFAQQATIDANEAGIKRTESLKKIMDLTADQEKQVIDLFQSVEQMKQKIAGQSRDGVIVLKRLKAIEEKEDAKLKDIFTEKQNAIYAENIKKMRAGGM